IAITPPGKMPGGCGRGRPHSNQRANRVRFAAMTEAAIQNKLFINGDFVDAQSGATFATINPPTEEKIADVASADVADVDAAVKPARAQMQPGPEWQKMSPRDRAKVLWPLADMVSARADDDGRIER